MPLITPPARDSARLLVTNPEMIHSNLLPGHSRWQRFLHGLKFVVLDEVHTYTGFFGANMANVIRRLDRICRHYGGAIYFHMGDTYAVMKHDTTRNLVTVGKVKVSYTPHSSFS